MYLVYEQLYGELVADCGESANIIGLYKNKEEALNVVNRNVSFDLQNNYVLDKERNNIEEDNYVRLFWKNQENWNCYYEICIEKMEVQE